MSPPSLLPLTPSLHIPCLHSLHLFQFSSLKHTKAKGDGRHKQQSGKNGNCQKHVIKFCSLQQINQAESYNLARIQINVFHRMQLYSELKLKLKLNISFNKHLEDARILPLRTNQIQSNLVNTATYLPTVIRTTYSHQAQFNFI